MLIQKVGKRTRFLYDVPPVAAWRTWRKHAYCIIYKADWRVWQLELSAASEESCAGSTSFKRFTNRQLFSAGNFSQKALDIIHPW